MFTLTLPKHERAGKCRINLRAAEFRVNREMGTISYRHEGGDWKHFVIRRVLEDDSELVTYCATEQADDSCFVFG
jgi:hypothetical protein